MIESHGECIRAKEELEHLEAWLARLEQEHPDDQLQLTKAGILKKIARIHEELVEFEGARD